ncbi:DNA cytosine methyltransferase [Erythrobacter sanguineus]|uniref:DNA (cytosine-5-)-methyltransferase n=1 Tax=Erythrobacter sanguineus TaxID=198312 RepID=A0A1M7RXX3_9SPHN|nr:DNA cytosine methyltransferase [Erythrobacter sanguineus]SHN51046.1 DNA (cytosine-5)-methyltransferase 1 [Erythrobacter sanguineus]
MPSTYGVIDLFAGPGGLGEGFAALEVDLHHPFRIGISVEKEASAHRTLTLRAFLREYRERHGILPEEYIAFHAGEREEPDWEQVDAEAWLHACSEARKLELGTEQAAQEIDLAIDLIRLAYAETILIGGPPCQAYSLVGRARSKGKKDYVPEQDERHFLFREYIRVLDRLRPAIFVMENVKGMLSAMVKDQRVFEMLLGDLASLGHEGKALYELRAISLEGDQIKLKAARNPRDFIVRAENFGVPQKRHRVIIVGIRSDLAACAVGASITLPSPRGARVEQAIGGLASLRSGISPQKFDGTEAWSKTVLKAAEFLAKLASQEGDSDLETALEEAAARMDEQAATARTSRILPAEYGKSNDPLMQWLENDELRALAQHQTRGHMQSDLARYLFVSAFGRAHGRSPKASEFPSELAPDHENWASGKFADRFRVQLDNEPATTVTSHISKDGHYFIHPDPAQCRSLTVREAARLQTFPDDYLFLGNRTQQYVQVGNAVPPYLAFQIARLLHAALEASSVAADP